MPKTKRANTDLDKMLRSVGDFRVYLDRAFLCRIVAVRDSVLMVMCIDTNGTENVNWVYVTKHGSLFVGHAVGLVSFADHKFLTATLESINGVWLNSGKFFEERIQWKESVEHMLTEASLTKEY
jgi:hypothetical protein